jgi:hypothetical protein
MARQPGRNKKVIGAGVGKIDRALSSVCGEMKEAQRLQSAGFFVWSIRRSNHR